MVIIIGADHNGFAHKKYLKEKLAAAGHTVIDVGPGSLDPDDDYPDFAIPLARRVAAGDGSRVRNDGATLSVAGVFICGSGNGPCMTANKIHGIRAGVARTSEDARMIRSHQDANILCLGAATTSTEESWKAVQKFIETKFEGGRHQRRIDKMMKLEERQS